MTQEGNRQGNVAVHSRDRGEIRSAYRSAGRISARPDPGDERHHYEKATKAAARYLKDLYSTDAQASGLLVMACYNWGEDNVLPLVRSMPANPRERNFWRLLRPPRQDPTETYDYVFTSSRRR